MMTATAVRTLCEKRIYLWMSQLCKCFPYAYRSKDLPGLTCTDSVQFQKKIPKISHHGSLSPKYKELGHFTLLFCRGRRRNAPRFKTLVHSHCSALWCRSRHRSRRGLLKLLIVRWETGHAFCVIGLKNIRIHPSTRYRIRCGYIFFHFGERIFFFRIRCRIRRILVDGSRIRKKKVADSKISGYVWTGPDL